MGATHLHSFHVERESGLIHGSFFNEVLYKKRTNFNESFALHSRREVLTHSQDTFNWGVKSLLSQNAEIFEFPNASAEINADFVPVLAAGKGSGAVMALRDTASGRDSTHMIECGAIAVGAIATKNNKPIGTSIINNVHLLLFSAHQDWADPHSANVSRQSNRGITEVTLAVLFL